MNFQEEFDPTQFRCQIHNKRLHGLDIRDKASKRLYCWNCVRELPNAMSTVHNIEEILTPEGLEDEEARLRSMAEALEQEAQATWANELDIILQGIIDRATELQNMITSGFKTGFQSLSLFEYEKLFEALMKYLETFARENRLEEGQMLDDYILIYKKFIGEAEMMKYKKQAYLVFRDEIKARLKNIDNIFNNMEASLKDLDRDLMNFPAKARMNRSPMRGGGGGGGYGSPNRMTPDVNWIDEIKRGKKLFV